MWAERFMTVFGRRIIVYLMALLHMHHCITDRPRVGKDLKEGGSHLFKRRSCYSEIFLR